MFDRIGLITTKQFEKISKQWHSILKAGENVCVVFPYFSDRQFRIRQYIDSINDKDLIPIIINPRLQQIDEISELKIAINQQIPNEYKKNILDKTLANLDKNKLIVITIIEGEALIEPDFEFLIELIQDLLLEFGNICTITAFETNIIKVMNDFQKFNFLFENIIYYPLYKDEEITFFVNFLCDRWPVKMPKTITKAITNNSGGFFWLAKEGFRGFRDSNTWSPDAPGFNFRVNSIYKKLSQTEREIIASCPDLDGYVNCDEYKYLKNIELIDDKNCVRVPELVKIVYDNNNKETNIFELANHEILLRGIALSGILSGTEYLLLKHFVANQNIIINRDEIAKVLWPKNENDYSQWAVDQAIRRLRSRLSTLRVPPTIIKSIRGTGYEFRV